MAYVRNWREFLLCLHTLSLFYIFLFLPHFREHIISHIKNPHSWTKIQVNASCGAIHSSRCKRTTDQGFEVCECLVFYYLSWYLMPQFLICKMLISCTNESIFLKSRLLYQYHSHFYLSRLLFLAFSSVRDEVSLALYQCLPF